MTVLAILFAVLSAYFLMNAIALFIRRASTGKRTKGSPLFCLFLATWWFVLAYQSFHGFDPLFVLGSFLAGCAAVLLAAAGGLVIENKPPAVIFAFMSALLLGALSALAYSLA